jgi:hypothetical protein
MAIDVTKYRRPNGVRLQTDACGEFTVYIRQNDVGDDAGFDFRDEDIPDQGLCFELGIDREGRHIHIWLETDKKGKPVSASTNVATQPDELTDLINLDTEDEQMGEWIVLRSESMLENMRQENIPPTVVEDYETEKGKGIVIRLPDWFFATESKPRLRTPKPESQTVSA